MDPSLIAQTNIEDMVMSGVNRLLSMQTPSGGFGYWPGATEPTDWGTAYVVEILLEAQKQGYPVPQDRIDQAVRYMQTQVDRFEANHKVLRDDWKYPGDPEPYMQLVLSMVGSPRKARMQELIQAMPANARGEVAEQLYMLEAGLYLAGDRRYEQNLKHPDTAGIADDRSMGWSFYSDRRRRGVMLTIHSDLFGADPAGEPLAQLVAEGLRAHQSEWYNTQEIAWSVVGLGKRIGQVARSYAPPVLLANDKKVSPVPPPVSVKSSDLTWNVARASEYRSMAISVSEKTKGALYLYVMSEGVREKASYEVGGHDLSVSRVYRRADGSEIDMRLGPTLGDVIYAELTLKNTGPEHVSNIALVDRFPAGWEIENPRLGRGGAVSWVDASSLWTPDYVDIRDDRFQVFGALNAHEERKVVYVLRAVTAGRFTVPPVEAMAMYDPRIWARAAGGAVTVEGPWAAYIQ